jgi:hypothetical protein
MVYTYVKTAHIISHHKIMARRRKMKEIEAESVKISLAIQN